jgi:hypothetical protein
VEGWVEGALVCLLLFIVLYYYCFGNMGWVGGMDTTDEWMITWMMAFDGVHCMDTSLATVFVGFFLSHTDDHGMTILENYPRVSCCCEA